MFLVASSSPVPRCAASHTGTKFEHVAHTKIRWPTAWRSESSSQAADMDAGEAL